MSWNNNTFVNIRSFWRFIDDLFTYVCRLLQAENCILILWTSVIRWNRLYLYDQIILQSPNGIDFVKPVNKIIDCATAVQVTSQIDSKTRPMRVTI